ncbi:MAG: hypothetical protein ACRD2E_05035 [Terriglobales bacterium]
MLTYDQNMQACCSTTPANCGVVNDDFTMIASSRECQNNCAPPRLGWYANGFHTFQGWPLGAAVQLYIDPALGTYNVPGEGPETGAVAEVQSALSAEAAAVGVTVEFVSAPPPAATGGTGYNIWLGGTHWDKCSAATLACTLPAVSASGQTTSAQAWAAWGSPFDFSATLETVAERDLYGLASASACQPPWNMLLHSRIA